MSCWIPPEMIEQSYLDWEGREEILEADSSQSSG